MEFYILIFAYRRIDIDKFEANILSILNMARKKSAPLNKRMLSLTQHVVHCPRTFYRLLF